MSKVNSGNGKNVITKIVAAALENNLGSEEGFDERVWSRYSFFDARKSKYSMEKVNFPENTQYHLNQSYLP